MDTITDLVLALLAIGVISYIALKLWFSLNRAIRPKPGPDKDPKNIHVKWPMILMMLVLCAITAFGFSAEYWSPGSKLATLTATEQGKGIWMVFTLAVVYPFAKLLEKRGVVFIERIHPDQESAQRSGVVSGKQEKKHG